MQRDIKKYAYIDALRGLAILNVLMVHCAKIDTHGLAPWFLSLTGAGAFGVQLFYIVSALTLFLSIDSRKDNEKFPVINFFIRRFFRIAPLFYIAVIYYLWQNGFGAPNAQVPERITAGAVLSTITFTNGLNPYWINRIVPGGWSIAIEMSFYLLLPFLFNTLKTLTRVAWSIAVTVIISKILVFILWRNPLIPDQIIWHAFLDFAMPLQLPVFLLGIALFHLIKNSQGARNEKDSRKGLSIFLLLLSVLLIGHSVMERMLYPAFLFGIGFFILTYSLYLRPFRIFVNPFLEFIGKISFSLYLTHFGVLHFMQKFHLLAFIPHAIGNYCIRYLLLLVFSACVSTITYVIIERPGQNLGKKLINFIGK